MRKSTHKYLQRLYVVDCLYMCATQLVHIEHFPTLCVFKWCLLYYNKHTFYRLCVELLCVVCDGFLLWVGRSLILVYIVGVTKRLIERKRLDFIENVLCLPNNIAFTYMGMFFSHLMLL